MHKVNSDIETTKVHCQVYAQGAVATSETKFNESIEEVEKELKLEAEKSQKRADGLQGSLLKNVKGIQEKLAAVEKQIQDQAVAGDHKLSENIDHL